MAFIPQLCSVEKTQDLSTYATKTQLLKYATKETLDNRATAMSDHTGVKLDRCASMGVSNTTNAINTHTVTMVNHIDKELLNYIKKTEEGDIDAQNHKVINLLDPVGNSHAV